MKKSCLVVVLCIALLASDLYAATCRNIGSSCVDSTPCKNISGANVCLADLGETCWRWQDTYECIDPAGIDYCAALQQAGCSQISSTCSQYDFNGACIKTTQTYRCGDLVGAAVGTVVLGESYTIVADNVDRAQCASYQTNASCRLAANVCVEPGGTRNIAGLPVYKDCWAWRETYTCIAQNYANYCIPLRQTPGCTEAANRCLSYAWDNSCNGYERTFRCDGRMGEPLPANVTHLDTQYTIVTDRLDTARCDPYKKNPNCTLAEKVCLQPAETRVIDGLPVYKDCWEWRETYTCITSTLTSDCGDLLDNSHCVPKAVTCLESNPDGGCGLLERVFSCQTSAGATSTEADCSGQKFCLDGNCIDTGHAADADFARVVASMEAMREAGMYLDEGSLTLFNGKGGSCSKKLGGLVNCCKAKSAAAPSNNLAMGSIAKGIGAGYDYARSTYMYDTLFQSDAPDWVLKSMYGADAGAALSPTFSYYGFTAGFGTTLGPGAIELFNNGSFVVGFDPVSFGISIAVQFVLNDLLSCDQSDQMVAMRKSNRLCHFLGSYCSKKFLGACLTKKEGYCCFNSHLSRIINEQGREQLGKGWGAPQAANCTGFTAQELQALDFSRMDLTEFYAEITPNQVDMAAIRGAIENRIVTDPTRSYYANP
jgi:conjugal transfer mating pair stabilization protein TraN